MYTVVSKLCLLGKAVFDAAVTCEEMSTKGMSKHKNDLVKVLLDDQSLRTSIDNLKL